MLRDGVVHLTIDAVAAESGMSKGGVLYHFPSKDDLILGMISRHIERYENSLQRQEVGDPRTQGRKLRSMLRASFPETPDNERSHMDRVAASLLAAVVNNPKLLEPVREQVERFRAVVTEDSRDPMLAMILAAAADGIWMADLFGFGLDRKTKKSTVDRMIELTRKV